MGTNWRWWLGGLGQFLGACLALVVMMALFRWACWVAFGR